MKPPLSETAKKQSRKGAKALRQASLSKNFAPLRLCVSPFLDLFQSLPIFIFATLFTIVSSLAADLPPSVPASQLEAAKQAKELFEHGDYRGAEKVFQGMLAAVPNNLYVLSNLGAVSFREGTPTKLKQAVEVLMKAIEIAPNDAFCHSTLGIVYCTQSHYDDAIKSLQRAIELNPKDATAHNYLSIAYSWKGMRQEAAKELGISRELDPSYNEQDKSPKEIPVKFRIHDS